MKRGFQVLQPGLEPLSFLQEEPAEFLAQLDKLAVALAGVEADRVLQLAVADAAVVEGPRLALSDVVATIHSTLIVDAVPDAEHVTDLMGHHLAGTVKHQVITLLWRLHFISVKFWRIPMKAKYTGLRHYISEPKHKAECIIRVYILCGYRNNAYGPWVLRFVNSKQPA